MGGDGADSSSSSSSSMESWRSWIWRLIDTTSRIHIWETGWWCALKKKKAMYTPAGLQHSTCAQLRRVGGGEGGDYSLSYCNSIIWNRRGHTTRSLVLTFLALSHDDRIIHSFLFWCTLPRTSYHPPDTAFFPYRLGNSRINWHYANISVKCECSQRAARWRRGIINYS